MFQSPGFAEAQRGQMWTHGNRHKPPGFRFGVNIKSHQGLVSRSFFFFFKQTLKKQRLFLLYLKVLPSPWTLIPGPKTHPREGFQEFLSVQL